MRLFLQRPMKQEKNLQHKSMKHITVDTFKKITFTSRKVQIQKDLFLLVLLETKRSAYQSSSLPPFR